MTNEEFLIPRFRVIADYPGNTLSVGKIIAGTLAPKELADWMEKYPHLFRKLEWYEGRKEEDMPTYIKIDPEWKPETKKDQKHIGKVMKPFLIIPMNDLSHYFLSQKEVDDNNMHNLTICLPATEEEYLEYTKNKQTK